MKGKTGNYKICAGLGVHPLGRRIMWKDCGGKGTCSFQSGKLFYENL